MNSKIRPFTKLSCISLFLVSVSGNAATLDVASYSGGGCCDTLTRGYVFIAPNDFTITSLDVSTGGSNEAGATLQIVSFSSFPPTYSSTTNSFTSLFYQTGSYTANGINILVHTGDIIGVLGYNGSFTPYSTESTGYITYINGEATELSRLGFQDLGMAHDLWTESGSFGYILLGYDEYLVTLADLQASLLSSASGLQNIMSNTDILVNGAHSRPMSRRVKVGEKTFWVSGDWGHDDHDSRDGTVGLAELGIGYNYGPAQVNLSIGKTKAHQNLIDGGKMDADGAYIMAEGILPLSNNLYATLGAYGHWGDLNSRRGYDVSGSTEYSSGTSDTKSWGIRARLDLENAFSYRSTSFSPYMDLWHSSADVDAYTESGGSFPTSFNAQSDHITDLRLGLNSSTPIHNSNLFFVANIEAVHRFDASSDGISGTVVGLGAFDLAGQKYDQNWLKAGLGIEGMVGNGKLSVMLNGTTEGEMPSAWLAASYQINF